MAKLNTQVSGIVRAPAVVIDPARPMAAAVKLGLAPAPKPVAKAEKAKLTDKQANQFADRIDAEMALIAGEMRIYMDAKKAVDDARNAIRKTLVEAYAQGEHVFTAVRGYAYFAAKQADELFGTYVQRTDQGGQTGMIYSAVKMAASRIAAGKPKGAQAPKAGSEEQGEEQGEESADTAAAVPFDTALALVVQAGEPALNPTEWASFKALCGKIVKYRTQRKGVK